MESHWLANREPMRPRDWGTLSLFTFAVLLFQVFYANILSTHEAVHCQNVQEMFASQQWLIPTYGDRPWLERPPVPHWLTGIIATLFGGIHQVWALRLASVLIGLGIVLLTAWVCSWWFHRQIAWLSGAFLVTMRQFNAYAAGTEADIHLCLIVTLCVVLVAQHQRNAQATDSISFIGNRPTSVWLWFGLMGVMNLFKGPLFGNAFVLVPLWVNLLLNRDGRGFLRYVWLWGWLIFLISAGTWYWYVYQQYPDLVDYWKAHLGDRVEKGYLGEPVWYYVIHQPWNVFPWTLIVLAGFFATARKAYEQRFSAERFLWCWALAPIVFFSLSKGKHHHYLLHCMPPVAILAALGLVRFWRWFQSMAWQSLRSPWMAMVVFGGILDLLIWAFRHKFPGPSWVPEAWMIVAPPLIAIFWWGLFRGHPVKMIQIVLPMIVGLLWATHVYRTEYMNSYEDDFAFLTRVKADLSESDSLYVLNDGHPLNGSWLLFYLDQRGKYLHHVSFLYDRRIPMELYLICPASHQESLLMFGSVTQVLQSRKTRGERSTSDRFTLYRIRLRDDLPRLDIPPDFIKPTQATGNAPGPVLVVQRD